MPPRNPSPHLDTLVHSLDGIAPAWRGRAGNRTRTQPTGFASLDDALPGGGWPLGALTEVVPVEDGIGEVRLLLPAACAMARLQRRVVFVGPPFAPNPPALHGHGLPLDLTLWIAANTDEDGIWAAVQLLRETSTGAVLLWSACRRDRTLRKLQLAAESGQALAFLFRRTETLRHASPAALRLELRPATQALEVRIHKARGGRPGIATVRLPEIRL